MKKRIFLLVVLFILAFGYQESDARLRWLHPYPGGENGTNGHNGTTQALAWATLGYADGNLIAGDTLMILGGIYVSLSDSSTVANSRNHFELSTGGTAGARIVIKAYGDSIAVFRGCGAIDYQYREFFYFTGNCDNVVVDGYSFLSPTEKYYIKLESRSGFSTTCDGSRHDMKAAILIDATSGNYCENITIKGIEIDGDFPPNTIVCNTVTNTLGVRAMTVGGSMRYGIWMFDAVKDTVQNCYIHHVYYPGGNISPGDETDLHQGTGEAVFINAGSRFVYVADNIFEYCNHAALSLESNTTTGNVKFCKIVNNHIYNPWGGGIYLVNYESYNLVDGNIVAHCGETTDRTKGPYSIGGNKNTFRRNIGYSPLGHGGPFDIYSYQFGAQLHSPDTNLIYNNTFFGCSGGTVKLNMTNVGGTVTYNEFKNNIFSWSSKRLNWDGRGNGTDDMPSEIDLYTLFADPASCWLSPYAAGTSPVSTHYGGNSFKYNIIYKDSAVKAAPNDSLISYIKPSSFGTYALSLADVQTDAGSAFYDPAAWLGNIEQDPLILSHSPDTYGRYNDWWKIKATSPCIDSGIAVNDTIGSYIESLYPGYGWSNLTYKGSAPDIGADEYDASTYSICSVSPTSMTFGTYPIGDSSYVDSFQVSNIGTEWINGQVSLSNYVDFSVVRNGGDFALSPGDSRWVVIKFNPQNGGALSCTISLGDDVCADVSCSGGGCLVTPSTIDFGDIKVGECSTVQTLTIKNSGTGTITGTVSGTDPDFEITDGTGAFSLTAGQEKVISLKFCPLSYGIKSFNIGLGSFFGISGVTFVAGSSTINTSFTTSETAGCRIYGGEYNSAYPASTVLDIWYSNATVHGTSHSHIRTGLDDESLYAIRIRVVSAGGNVVYAPSSDGYYVVQTGVTGGIKGTYPEILMLSE